MGLDFWMIFWKVTLIAGVLLFFAVAVVVTFFGAVDIKKLFKSLAEGAAPVDESADKSEPPLEPAEPSRFSPAEPGISQ